MSDLVIVTDMSCTSRICGPLLRELWPGDPPKVVSLPVKGLSVAHEKFVADYRAAHGGAFLEPFLAEHDAIRNKVALVGFSAGCWGVRDIIASPAEAAMVGCVVAIDGMHGKYDGTSVAVPKPWVDYAERAARGQAAMIVSYSAIEPGAYPSTGATAHTLARNLGVTLGPGELAGVECQELGQSAGLAIIGAWPPGTKGSDAAAHVYQANVVQEAIWKAYLQPWSIAPADAPPWDPPASSGTSAAGGKVALALAAAATAAGLLLWAAVRSGRFR